MAERKTSIIYESFYDAIRDLEEQDFVKMMKAYCDYVFYGKDPELSGYLLAMWKMIRPVLEKNSQLYENGSKGGRPRKDEKTEVEPIENQPKTKRKPSGNQDREKTKPAPSNDKDDDVDKDEDLDKDLSLSAKAAGAKEREEFLKILFFEKQILRPQAELERFINHYEKCGWVDAHGNAIRNRAAALRAWSPAKDAEKVPKPIRDAWFTVQEAVKEADPDCDATVMLTQFRGLHVEGPNIYITAGDIALRDFLETDGRRPAMHAALKQLYGPDKNVNYRIPRR